MRPAIVATVPDYQRILVVSTATAEADLLRLRRDLGRDPVVLAPPTPEARRVVDVLQVTAQAERLLMPVRSPQVDRGHQLDHAVREHALRDRFRVIVVVTDPASIILLLRVLAPDQLATGGAVTVVGIARGERPVVVRRALLLGLVVGVAVGVVQQPGAILVLPGAVLLAGVLLVLVPRWRHIGRELLVAAGVAAVVGLMVVAGSARFPAGW